MEQPNHKDDPSARSTDPSEQPRHSNRHEKRHHKVSTSDGSKDRVHSGVARGGGGGSGKPKTSDTDLDSSNKKTLLDYHQTANVTKIIGKLNSKESASAAQGKAPRTSMIQSVPLGASPTRSSPSPPRRHDFSMDPSMGVEERFGFFDPGPGRSQTFSRRADQHESWGPSQISDEQRSRATLNKQSEFLMGQAQVDGQHGFVGDGRVHHDGRGHVGWLGQHDPGLAPPNLALPPFPDLSGSYPKLMFDMMYKLGEVQAKVNQNTRQEKVPSLPKDRSPPPKSSQDKNASDTDKSMSDSEDEVVMDWSGQPIESRSSELQISEPAMEYWSSLVGVDEKGMQDMRFKNLPKKTQKVKLYTENKKAMNPQEIETEIPRMWGHLLKQEDELSSSQRVVGAAATAICLSVDAARATVEDLKATGKDFENGDIEDPSAEAARMCAAVAEVLEEKVISNSIQALKFTASTFGSYTLKRRSLALRQVSDPETKRVLEKTPPNADYLFGGKVKEGVQQSRDSNQMKRAFHFQKRDVKPKKYSNTSSQKDKSGNKYTRPMAERFKGGNRKWKGPKGRDNLKKRKDAKEDD